MPDWKPEIRRRLAKLKLVPLREAAIIEELSQHLDDCYGELLSGGATEAEARRQTLAELSGSEMLQRELCRVERQAMSEPIVLGTNRRANMIADLWQDLRFGSRMLRKKPGFTFIAVLTLALGIGVNAAIFSVVDGVLLRPLRYQHADQLVRIWSADQKTGQRFLETSYQDFQQFKQQARAFAAMAAFSEAPRILRDDRQEPGSITVARISEGFFPVFSIAPQLGRDFLVEEYARGERTVLLSHRLWQQRYAAKPDILGQTISIDGEPHTVVGVMPEGYGYSGKADLWKPLTEKEKQDDDPELSLIALLEPRATLAQGEAEISTTAQRIAQSSPQNAQRTAWVQTMQAMVVREVRTPLLVLLGATALVLLIACTNIANLLLARGLAREQEIAIRTALGAGRGRIVRQLLAESILITTLGGAMGLLLGVWALKAIVLLSPENIPRLNEVALDGRVVAVMIAVTTLAGVILGLVPALQASQLDPHNVLKGGSRGATGSRSKQRLRQGLVIAEVALATVLMIGAGLLLKSFGRLVSFDHGFRAENVLVVPLTMRGQINPQFASFYDQALEQVRALPRVESASLAMATPMDVQGLFRRPFQIEGQARPAGQEPPLIGLRPISADYFKTVSIPLLSGRTFNEQDRAGAQVVAVVNQTFVKTYFPQSQAVGRRLQSEVLKGQSILIVGVVADVLPEAGVVSRPALYLPFSQFPIPGMSLLLRTAGNPLNLVPAIRERIRSLDPNVPLDKFYPLEQKVAEATISPRFTLALIGLFAALGVVLAAVGIYGVMSYAVAERAREIGIRMALGAQHLTVLRLILAQGLKLTLFGLGLGLSAALGLTRWLKNLLFGVTATDPLTFAAMAMLLLLVAGLACWMPARRATKVDPMIALRRE
ncbi:MAG: ADOP family duplicated permease [Blastocatellia bacterium]